mmetsp:Transcript_33263/g.61834  ORF Transcript_33263/g.61834 Transcript_33263/m.61834 type:complete len:313 (+) Transcript_33263:72-1010(+)
MACYACISRAYRAHVAACLYMLLRPAAGGPYAADICGSYDAIDASTAAPPPWGRHIYMAFMRASLLRCNVCTRVPTWLELIIMLLSRALKRRMNASRLSLILLHLRLSRCRGLRRRRSWGITAAYYHANAYQRENQRDAAEDCHSEQHIFFEKRRILIEQRHENRDDHRRLRGDIHALSVLVSFESKFLQGFNCPHALVFVHLPVMEEEQRWEAGDAKALPQEAILRNVNFRHCDLLFQRFGEFLPCRGQLPAMAAPRRVELYKPVTSSCSRRGLRIMFEVVVGQHVNFSGNNSLPMGDDQQGNKGQARGRH